MAYRGTEKQRDRKTEGQRDRETTRQRDNQTDRTERIDRQTRQTAHKDR